MHLVFCVRFFFYFEFHLLQFYWVERHATALWMGTRKSFAHKIFPPLFCFVEANGKKSADFFAVVFFQNEINFCTRRLRFSSGRQNRRCRVSHSRSRTFVLTEWMWNVFFIFFIFLFVEREENRVLYSLLRVSFPFSCSLQIIRIFQHCMIAQTQNAFEFEAPNTQKIKIECTTKRRTDFKHETSAREWILFSVFRERAHARTQYGCYSCWRWVLNYYWRAFTTLLIKSASARKREKEKSC